MRKAVCIAVAVLTAPALIGTVGVLIWAIGYVAIWLGFPTVTQHPDISDYISTGVAVFMPALVWLATGVAAYKACQEYRDAKG